MMPVTIERISTVSKVMSTIAFTLTCFISQPLPANAQLSTSTMLKRAAEHACLLLKPYPSPCGRMMLVCHEHTALCHVEKAPRNARRS